MATYYGVAAGGNWSSASTWASTSGGSGGAGVPGGSDDVILDGNSGAISLTASTAVRSLDCNSGGAAGAYTHTLTHAASTQLQVGTTTTPANNVGLRFSSGMTYTLGSVT